MQLPDSSPKLRKRQWSLIVSSQEASQNNIFIGRQNGSQPRRQIKNLTQGLKRMKRHKNYVIELAVLSERLAEKQARQNDLKQLIKEQLAYKQNSIKISSKINYLEQRTQQLQLQNYYLKHQINMISDKLKAFQNENQLLSRECDRLNKCQLELVIKLFSNALPAQNKINVLNLLTDQRFIDISNPDVHYFYSDSEQNYDLILTDQPSTAAQFDLALYMGQHDEPHSAPISFEKGVVTSLYPLLQQQKNNIRAVFKQTIKFSSPQKIKFCDLEVPARLLVQVVALYQAFQCGNEAVNRILNKKLPASLNEYINKLMNQKNIDSAAQILSRQKINFTQVISKKHQCVTVRKKYVLNWNVSVVKQKFDQSSTTSSSLPQNSCCFPTLINL